MIHAEESQQQNDQLPFPVNTKDIMDIELNYLQRHIKIDIQFNSVFTAEN